jgi:FAD/FMN-containing dehydrogenase
VVTQTGAAGLTLGGGIGHLTRRFGATVDNVLSIDVVTMDGRVLSASEDTNADLFWGLRGAGHSLAIARSFTNQARKVGPDVMSGFLVYSAEDAVGVRRPRRGDGFLARELAVALLVLPGTPVAGAAGAHDRNPDPDGAGRLHRAAG